MKNKSVSFSAMLFYSLFFFISVVYSELVVLYFSLGFEIGLPIYMIMFALSLSFLLGGICALCSIRARKTLSLIFTLILLIIYVVQLVYYRFCDSFMSVVQVAMGGDALTRFGEAAKLEIIESLGGIVLLLIPVTVLLVLTARKNTRNKKGAHLPALCAIGLFILLHISTVLCLPISGTQIYSPYDIYHDTFVLGMSTRHFGIFTSLRLELRGLIFGTEASELIDVPEITDNTDDIIENGEPDVSVEYDYNVTDIDFDTLLENEADESVKALHKYFSAQSGTKQNEYTGIYEGYNLILICAESFSPYIIDKERTPTLYKLASEGYRFTDFYNTVCDNTSNGEYAILTGLVPDTSLLGKGWTTFYSYNSFTASQENAMPFCLGNQYLSNGAATYAIHNYYYNYYGRHNTHPNLGYTWKAMYRGLEVNEDWPTSDVSMMEQTLPLLLTKNEDGGVTPFHAYFLTFSGHMPYTFGYNTMADKNKAMSDSLPYSSKVRCYIAAQQELEYALDYMMQQLEEAGVLDNTLIVLTNDHYPYPLGLDYLSELAGKEMDEQFDKYRSGLIMWSADMKEPVEVNVPCCSLDILPTLSNMLGFTYDSRLLMGTDIFSDGEHIAILADRSFVTDKVLYNCVNGEVTLRDGVTELDDGYLESYIALVKNKFTLSTEILYNDYYAKVYE
ncbi:MAG: sulfatase-like hydrolase/transferase [Clostridia bacterium]|nr:sulfatase-like hydrolase/transferase [Clostridia bacterium]